MTLLNVGIITVPLSPGKKYFKVCGDGYIASSHINWLKRAGISIVAIPYDTTRFKWYFNRINGLYLPSGGVFASNSEAYYKCCKKFLQIAINANNNNIHHNYITSNTNTIIRAQGHGAVGHAPARPADHAERERQPSRTERETRCT